MSTKDKYFDELRNENLEHTFPSAENWLRTVNSNYSNIKTERKSNSMKNFFAAYKLKLAYTFLILAFVVAACNYPVTQQESAGDVLKWTVSADNTEAISKIENLDWFKNGEYNINEDNSTDEGVRSYSIVIPIESHSKVADYDKQLSAIDGIIQVRISPLSETIKRPVYSAVLNDLFKIDINASNMSDAELSKEIDAQLKNAGIESATVEFEKGPDGHRKVKVVVPEEQIKKDGGFDLTVKDGDNVNRIKEVRKDGPGGADKFKGKSDEDIKKMVKEDLKDLNLKDDQIEIMREGDKVMVKVNKTGMNNDSKIELEDEVK